MGIKSIIGATCTCLAVVSFSADAALIGRLAATPGGTDYQAYYDNVADLTWLADANAAGTHLDWVSANVWVANLVVAGNDNWRLAASDEGCSAYNCTGSEMGNLFYNVLGGTAGTSIVRSHNSNYDLFSNIKSDAYWSATEYTPVTFSAWYFGTSNGVQGYSFKSNAFFVWAVQSGDVSAVPVPAAVWLFGSGLIGLIGVARRKS